MRWLDDTYVRFWPRRGVFEDGWGDEATVERGLDLGLRDEEPEPAAIRWLRAREQGGVKITEGELTSTAPDLPAECRIARVRLIEPRQGEPRGLVVALAAWNDEALETRQRLLARAVDGGVAALVLENPLYGTRRRVGQVGPSLRTVSDFVAMGRATVLEARALMAWARPRFRRVGVCGFSMGAQMAAMSAVLLPWPVRTILVATALSPARVFFDGPLVAEVRRAPLGAGGFERLRGVMERLSVLDLPPPRDPRLARLVGTRADGIVPPGDTALIARHWGAPVRWIDDGHVSAVLRRPHAFGQAVQDAFT